MRCSLPRVKYYQCIFPNKGTPPNKSSSLTQVSPIYCDNIMFVTYAHRFSKSNKASFQAIVKAPGPSIRDNMVYILNKCIKNKYHIDLFIYLFPISNFKLFKIIIVQIFEIYQKEFKYFLYNLKYHSSPVQLLDFDFRFLKLILTSKPFFFIMSLCDCLQQLYLIFASHTAGQKFNICIPYCWSKVNQH